MTHPASPLRLWQENAATQGTIRPQSAVEARALVAGASSTHFAIWSGPRPQPILLPRDAALKQIESAGQSALLVVPLAGQDRAQWQAIIDQTTASLHLPSWLGAADQPAPTDAPRREADAQADRAARENLRRAVHKLLLGE